MSRKMYHVVEVGKDIGNVVEYRERLVSSSEKEVEEKLDELIPLHSIYNVKIFTEVEYAYKGMSQLKIAKGGD